MSDFDRRPQCRTIDWSTLVYGTDPSAINPNEITYEFDRRRFLERPAPRDDDYQQPTRSER